MIETGLPVGHIVNGKLVKRIKPNNVLRYPEKSFTIDKQLFEAYKDHIKGIVIILESTYYKLSLAEFNKLKIPYNYGNGDSYRVPVYAWSKTSEQKSLI